MAPVGVEPAYCSWQIYQYSPTRRIGVIHSYFVNLFSVQNHLLFKQEVLQEEEI